MYYNSRQGWQEAIRHWIVQRTGFAPYQCTMKISRQLALNNVYSEIERASNSGEQSVLLHTLLMWVSEQGNREHAYPTISKRLSPKAFTALRDALINRDHQAAYQYLEETYECKRPVDQIDLLKSAELAIISSLLTDIPGLFHAWSRKWPSSEQMPPRLEAVFHNNRKDPYKKLRWTISNRQGCAEELKPAAFFIRRECIPSLVKLMSMKSWIAYGKPLAP